MKRFYYLFFMIPTLLVGLTSRSHRDWYNAWLVTYLGDILWAMLIYWICRLLIFQKPLWYSVIASLLFSYLIEISELYHAPWIDAIRNTRLGGLVLGFDFVWSDFISYTIGILAAWLIDYFIKIK